MGTIKQPAALLATGILLLSGGLAVAQQTTTGEHQQATADSKTAGQLGKSDRKFILKAIDGGMAEVEIGKLAQQKASSDKVKQIGQMLIQDHSKAGTELQQIASQKGVGVPSEEKEKDKNVGKLASLSGEKFDREFLKRQYRDHEDDIRQFERVAEKSDDSDLKTFASNTLPTLQKHRDMIRRAAEGMGLQVAAGTATNGMQNDRGDQTGFPGDGAFPGRTPADGRYPPGTTPSTMPQGQQSPNSTTPRP